MIVYLPYTRWTKIKELKETFKQVLGQDLDIKSPKTFNEKLQWLKLNYTDNVAKQGADKFKVRGLVRDRIGEKYLILLLGIYDTPQQINWGGLPKKFVVKITDGYDQHIICTNKNGFNVKEAISKLESWLRPTSRIYWNKGSLQSQYKKTKPKIMIEEFIGSSRNVIDEYKFLYINNKLAFILVPINRSVRDPHKVELAYYDKDWKRLDITLVGRKMSAKGVRRPQKLNEMLKVSKKLAKDFPVCRVDLYVTKNGIKFGELTFTPDDGRAKFSPEGWDVKFGSMLNLPKRNNYTLIEWKPIELPTRVNEDIIRGIVKPKIKHVFKSVLPYSVVERYKSRHILPTTIKDSDINIRFLGKISDKDIIDTLSQNQGYIHFGQSAEDAILNRIFHGKRNGFYVDVGAFHPSLISNTFLFHKFLGWNGINIDAYKDSIDKYNIKRPDDININIAVGREEKVQKMTLYSDLARNTFSDYNRKRQKKKGDTEIIGTTKVEVKPLSKIFDKYLPKGTQIDFLDIDIEGYDLQALETNNWKKYRPTVILIEDYAINTVGFTKSEIYKYMKKQDYRFFSHNFDTSIYIDNNQEVDIR